MQKTILIMLLLLHSAYAVSITEVMYNPVDGNEWVELYVNGSYNITGTQLKDNSYADEIGCCGSEQCNMTVPEETYFLVLDQDTTMNLTNKTYFCVDDNAVGNGLGNSGDEIGIMKNNVTIVNMSYSGGGDKGKSLALINSSWIEASPTPGLANFFHEIVSEALPDIVVSSLLPEKPITNRGYKLFRLENTNYPEYSKGINLTFYYNITKAGNIIFGEQNNASFKSHTTTAAGFMFEEAGNYSVCGEVLWVSANDTNISNNRLCSEFILRSSESIQCNITHSMATDRIIYDEGGKTEIVFSLSNDTFPFEIEYWIEDVFGEVVKKKITTSNTNRKSFTPSFSGKEKAFLIKSDLTYAACNNTAISEAEKLIVFRGNATEELLESSIIIEDVPEDAAFGDAIKVKVGITKGDTLKNSVKSYIEAASETTSFNLYGKNQKYSFTIPLRLKDNCDGRYETGEHEIVVEGLGVSVSDKINIEENPDCGQEEEKPEPKEADGPQKEKGAGKKNLLTGQVVYESSDITIKEYSKYFLAAVVFVALYLFLERLGRH